MEVEAIMSTGGREPPMVAAASSCTITISPSWKLYDNPFFNHTPHHGHHYYRRLAGTMEDYSRIRELKAELELERRLRRKAEAINKILCSDVAEEKRRREAAERDVVGLSEELSRARSDHAERARSGVLKEEGKLAEQSPPPEERYQKEQEPEQERRRRQRRKEAVENPHIKRGIMGFVEFPRVVRTSAGSAGLSREGGAKGNNAAAGQKLECQKAQLRVLLKNNRVMIPVVGGGRLGPSGTESLVM